MNIILSPFGELFYTYSCLHSSGASRFHHTCSSKVDGFLDYVELFIGARWDYYVDLEDTLGKIST